MNKPPLTIYLLNQAITAKFKEITPGVEVHPSPTYRDVPLPAWYINYIPINGTSQEMGNRFMREFCIDMVYLIEKGDTTAQLQYAEVAEKVDESLLFIPFPYVDENGESQVALLRPFDCQWRIDGTALHYRFSLNLRASLPEGPFAKMETIEELETDLLIDA